MPIPARALPPATEPPHHKDGRRGSPDGHEGPADLPRPDDGPLGLRDHRGCRDDRPCGVVVLSQEEAREPGWAWRLGQRSSLSSVGRSSRETVTVCRVVFGGNGSLWRPRRRTSSLLTTETTALGHVPSFTMSDR